MIIKKPGLYKLIIIMAFVIPMEKFYTRVRVTYDRVEFATVKSNFTRRTNYILV